MDVKEESTSMSFAELYEETLKLKNFVEGQIVKGKVIAIQGREAVVDIGYKSEGTLAIDEFDDSAQLQVGSEVEVLFEGLEPDNGMAILSKRKAERQKCWDDLLVNAKEGTVVQGRIFKKVRGGFMVDIGMEAFLPASLVDLKPSRNLDQFLGLVSSFLIVKINHKRKNIVVSRRDYLEQEKGQAKSRMIQGLALGQLIKGRVKNITDFGAFIDLGGVDGLLHITDLSWARVAHPSEVLNLGDEAEVMVIALDRENEKISLGLKQISKNPWEDVEQKYQSGSKVKGKVTNILPYGAFVELEPGIEGLVHISELSWTRRVAHPSEILAVANEIEAVILNVDKDARKISLGLKQMSASPWETLGARYRVGDVIEGKVRNITDYGLFVEVEPGIDGLIHVSDLSWLKKGNHPFEAVKKGQIIQAKILAMDAQNRKISLGVKQLTEDPWPRLTCSVQPGADLKGRITKIVNFGIFVELDNGLEGLVHISEIPHDRAQMVESSFRVGESVHVRVLHIDDENRKIALSLKGARQDH